MIKLVISLNLTDIIFQKSMAYSTHLYSQNIHRLAYAPLSLLFFPDDKTFSVTLGRFSLAEL